MKSKTKKEVKKLRSKGYSNLAIADKTKTSEKEVRKVLNKKERRTVDIFFRWEDLDDAQYNTLIGVVNNIENIFSNKIKRKIITANYSFEMFNKDI